MQVKVENLGVAGLGVAGALLRASAGSLHPNMLTSSSLLRNPWAARWGPASGTYPWRLLPSLPFEFLLFLSHCLGSRPVLSPDVTESDGPSAFR